MDNYLLRSMILLANVSAPDTERYGGSVSDRIPPQPYFPTIHPLFLSNKIPAPAQSQ